MGTTYTSAADLGARAAYRKATGTTYAYSSTMHSTPRADRKVHETLDPKGLNKAGIKIRESLDSPEHPLSLPIFVGFDETGSMGDGPLILQNKLAGLKGFTLRAGLVDAHIGFGAYGDADIGEVAPCQVGQFEAGIEMEEWLNNLFLEGAGGGNGHETAGLLLWFLANYSKLDSLDKRGKKGYLFLTGDEISGPVTRQQVSTYIGENIEADIPMTEVVRQVREKYNVYFFLVDNGAARQQGSKKFWTDLLGNQNVIIVENLETVPEMIAMIVAREEGLIDTLDHGLDLLRAEGSSSTDLAIVSSTLAAYDKGSSAKPVVATTSGEIKSFTAGDSDLL